MSGPRLGLRVDVCTSEGLRWGVPRLLALFRRLGIRTTFFVAMGPDRSGLAVLRILRRGFLSKMLRTGAVSMYGARTMLSGTLLAPPMTGRGSPDLLRRISDQGHEVGIHGWDHVLWQDHLPRMSPDAIRRQLFRAADAFERILKTPPRATAAPAWLATEASLEAQESLALNFASDARGRAPFLPQAAGLTLSVPQIPVTLPTLDETLGRRGITEETHAASILRALERPQVYAIHAEAEGRAYLASAERLLRQALEATPIVPLGEFAEDGLPSCRIRLEEIPGRAGRVAVQH